VPCFHPAYGLTHGGQDFLDLIANAGSKKIIIVKRLLTEDFFDLSTAVAGEILQKASDYSVRMAVVGDFSNLSF